MKARTENISTEVRSWGSFRFALKNYAPILILCVLAALMFLWRLGNASLRDWDEAIYAQISKEMVRNGTWLTPYYGYQPWFDKPPLFMWITAILYKLFGINEFWSRVTAALSGLGVIVLTYLIGHRLHSKAAGLLSILVLLTGFQYTRFARSSMLDMPLVLLVYLSIYAYVQLNRGSSKWWYLIWISFALALLVKSAAALVIPISILGTLLLDRKLMDVIGTKPFWLGFLLALLIVLPWHVAMYIQNGQVFIENYLGYRIITRATQAIEGNSGDVLFYARVMRDQFFPWFYIFPFAFLINLPTLFRRESSSRILVLIVVVVFGLYTVIGTKLPWYILPMYPALAILTAFLIVKAMDGRSSVAFGFLVIGTLMAATRATLSAVALFSVLIAFVVSFLLIYKRPIYRPLTVLMFTFLMVNGLEEVWPLYTQNKEPIAQLAQMAGSVSSEDREPLLVYSGIDAPTPLFYSDRPIIEVETENDIVAYCNVYRPSKILFAKADIVSLAKYCELQVVAESGSFIYGTIQQKR